VAISTTDPDADLVRRGGQGSRPAYHHPYQLRIYVPDGFTARRAELSDSIAATMKTDGNLLTVDFTASTGKDVDWKVFF
jgi:hypothetical protein